VFAGQLEFQKTITESGEMVGTRAVADPAQSATVRVRDGAPTTVDGLFLPGRSYLCGYYLVDCADRQRAIELAGLIPDARYTGVEVRQIIHEAGTEA
jgi:hypothetical protein